MLKSECSVYWKKYSKRLTLTWEESLFCRECCVLEIFCGFPSSYLMGTQLPPEGSMDS